MLRRTTLIPLCLLAFLAASGAGCQDPVAPIDDAQVPSSIRGVVAGSQGGDIVLIGANDQRRKLRWNEAGAFEIADAPSGRVTVAFSDGAGRGALLDVVVQPRGVNDLGSVPLVPLAELPELLALRGVGFEERLTTGAGDLSSLVMTSDFKTAYGLRADRVVQIDLGTGSESEVNLCGGMPTPPGLYAPVLSLVADRFLVLWSGVVGPSLALVRDGVGSSGFVFDLAHRDDLESRVADGSRCTRGIYGPGWGQYLIDAWVHDGTLLLVVGSFLGDDGSVNYRIWFETWRYSATDTVAVDTASQIGPFGPVAALDLDYCPYRVLGVTDVVTLIQLGGEVVVARSDSGALTGHFALPQGFNMVKMMVSGDELVGVYNSQDHSAATLRWLSTATGEDARPALDFKAHMPPDTTDYIHRLSVMGLDQATGRVAVIVEGHPLNTQPWGVISSAWVVDARLGRLTEVPLAFAEGARQFGPTLLGGEPWFPKPFAVRFPTASSLRIETLLENGSMSDAAVIEYDGTRSTGRFFAMGLAQRSSTGYFFSLTPVSSRNLEVRFKHDTATSFIQAFVATAGAADQSFRQRTWVSADHNNPFLSPDGRWVFTLVRDPVGGFVQLFRLEL